MGDQDGRVGEHRPHFHPWTYQKYISLWNSSHWKLPGDQQKDLYN